MLMAVCCLNEYIVRSHPLFTMSLQFQMLHAIFENCARFLCSFFDLNANESFTNRISLPHTTKVPTIVRTVDDFSILTQFPLCCFQNICSSLLLPLSLSLSYQSKSYLYYISIKWIVMCLPFVLTHQISEGMPQTSPIDFMNRITRVKWKGKYLAKSFYHFIAGTVWIVCYIKGAIS